jgi:anti-sigma-K factor RskA
MRGARDDDDAGNGGGDGDELALLAGEYVLGVLQPEQAARVEARMRQDHALASAVDYWEQRLHGLTAVAAPAEVTERLWRRIEAHLDGPQMVLPSPLRQAVGLPRRLWESLALWRAASAVMAAAAVMLAVLAFQRGGPPGPVLLAPLPAFVAVLQTPQGARPGYLVHVGADRSLELVPLVVPEVAPDKALQFWTLADPARGPLSLGLVPPGATIRLPPGTVPEVRPDQLFELTLEPYGGSPTGQPTGPIQFVGRAAARVG